MTLEQRITLFATAVGNDAKSTLTKAQKQQELIELLLLINVGLIHTLLSHDIEVDEAALNFYTQLN